MSNKDTNCNTFEVTKSGSPKTSYDKIFGNFSPEPYKLQNFFKNDTFSPLSTWI